MALQGTGAKAYLDGESIIALARAQGCDAIHPGYGFLSEQGDFAERCADEGIIFIGPRAGHLNLFGDKGAARAAAIAAGVPVPGGIDHAMTLAEAEAFFDTLEPGGAMIIKAIFGGGGRGTRVVDTREDVAEAYRRCQSEAIAAFGVGDLYAEEFVERARHIEIQILGDQQGNITHLGERECSAQRRNQKLLETAPAVNLDAGLRGEIIEAAVRFAQREHYSNLGTFEFLVDEENARFVFIEVNARLQVEHTVTEEVTGVDLVQTQILLAAGHTLADLGLDDEESPVPRGYAIQARVNMETIDSLGNVQPQSGILTAYEAPNGPGVRTDGFGYAGYQTSSSFDSLLAKVIVQSPARRVDAAIGRLSRALSEFRIEGVSTNISLLNNIIRHSDFAGGRVHTRWIDEHLEDLAGFVETPERFIRTSTRSDRVQRASSDPLALFDQSPGATGRPLPAALDNSVDISGPDGAVGVVSSMQATVVSVDVGVGTKVRSGQPMVVVEAMKMEHLITADRSGVVRQVGVSPGDLVHRGQPLVFIEEAEVAGELVSRVEEVDPDHIRDDLQENYDRHGFTLDENRPEAVQKRHARGGRMARENIADLLDDGSFKEYWPLVVARQHQRHETQALREMTPADGVITGTGTINADLVGEDAARAAIVHYDYTVMAGTQGLRSHYKQDRLFDLAERFKLPLVLFSEGGGGRPGEDSAGPAVSFDTPTFTRFAKLSGAVPLVGVNHGRCFAGNTALLACCDVIIATESSTIAMGGPAMIEGGGLGVYTPEEVGPMSTQVPNGTVDILVEDEGQAVRVAKKYLSYFQGLVQGWEASDQRPLRHMVPENRLRLYDMREIIRTIADGDSVLELREQFGRGIITAFIRVEGKPMGLIANNPHYLAGAVDSDGADKGARFMQLCDAFDIPLLSLVDCPGMMVGPDVEATALVRHSVRLFNRGANLSIPLFSVVVRKGYGLGVQAMCGGSSLVGFFSVAWPTAEFSAMNIEGAVKLGYRKELMAIEDPKERLLMFQKRVDQAQDDAKAVNAAMGGGLDDVIDPADTRSWIAQSLKRLPPTPPRSGKKYPCIDTW